MGRMMFPWKRNQDSSTPQATIQSGSGLGGFIKQEAVTLSMYDIEMEVDEVTMMDAAEGGASCERYQTEHSRVEYLRC